VKRGLLMYTQKRPTFQNDLCSASYGGTLAAPSHEKRHAHCFVLYGRATALGYRRRLRAGEARQDKVTKARSMAIKPNIFVFDATCLRFCNVF